MKTSKSIYYLEFKNFTRARVYPVFLVLYLILMGMLHVALNEYHREIKETRLAAELERTKAGQFHRYTPYSVYGIRLLCRPAPLEFLSVYRAYNGLASHVDTGTKLAIYESKKGNNITPATEAGNLNFAGLLLLLGSLLAVWYGYPAFHNKEYLKYLCCCKHSHQNTRTRRKKVSDPNAFGESHAIMQPGSQATILEPSRPGGKGFHSSPGEAAGSMTNGHKAFKKVFLSILTARAAILSAFLFILLGSAVILARLNRIDILDTHYLYFALQALAVLNFFLGLGILCGALKKRDPGIVLLVGTLVFLLLLAPWIAVKVINNITITTSEYRTEFDQLKVLMAFEKAGIKRFGDVRSGEEFQKLVKSYLETQLEIITDMENNRRQQLKEKIEKYQTLTVLLPTSFYLESSAELSGKGYKNYFDFYEFTMAKKKGFIEYYFDKEYFNPVKPGNGVVESYIKGEDSIFQCESSLAGNYILGMLLTLFYLALLVGFSYFIVRNKVYPVKAKLEGEGDLFIHLEKGKEKVLYTGDELVKAKVYNHFTGVEKLKSEIEFFHGEDVDTAEKIDFAYLPNIAALRGIDTRTWYVFLTGRKPGQNLEKWQVMLEHALHANLVVMNEFFTGLEPGTIVEILRQMRDKEKFVLVVTADYYMTKALADPQDIFYMKGDPTADAVSVE